MNWTEEAKRKQAEADEQRLKQIETGNNYVRQIDWIWHKIIELNNKLPVEIRCRFVNHCTYMSVEGKFGSICFTEKFDKHEIYVSGAGIHGGSIGTVKVISSRISDQVETEWIRSAYEGGYARGSFHINTSVPEILLKNICTGKPVFEDLRKKGFWGIFV
ncbi:MAG: hypothetical protein WCZ08_01755 [Parcubacteria group bacterium]|nr:hypothetical protein [Candidatus Moranbacteria bacterium]